MKTYEKKDELRNQREERKVQAIVESDLAKNEALEENDNQAELTARTINEQLEYIRKVLKRNKIVLTKEQIINVCITDVYATLKDDIPSTKRALIDSLSDAVSGEVEIEPYEMYLLGDYITVREWTEKHGGDVNNMTRYCHVGRVPGARKSGDVWLIPENAKVMPVVK